MDGCSKPVSTRWPRRARQQQHAGADCAKFALTQLAFWLLAVTHGRAKNFSIQHRRGAQFHLAPLYDVLSAWPINGCGPNQLPYQRANLAMALQGQNLHRGLNEIDVKHGQRLAVSCGPGVFDRMTAMVERVDDAPGMGASRAGKLS